MKLHYLTPEEEAAIKKTIPWEEIDRKIRDLVRLANEVKGIATLQSCAGHVQPRDDYFTVDSAEITFRATEERALEFLFETIPNWREECVEVGVRYFNNGTFWLSIGVDPSERGTLYDLFRKLRGDEKDDS